MKNIFLILTIFAMTIALQNDTLAFGPGGTWVDPPAGMPDCSQQDAPGNTACIATPICNLNGYCGQTSSSYSADYWSQLGGSTITGAFCGSIENNAFLEFTANASSISFDVYVYNCYSGEAIQIMIFKADNCNSGPVTSLVCVNEMYAQNTPYVVAASGLTPGDSYYIMIDGYAGDVCDYTFVATEGVATPIDVEGQDLAIDANQNFTICLGGSVTVNAEGGLGNYVWSGDPGLGATTGDVVTITPPSQVGVYNYSIESSGNVGLCPDATTLDFTVTVVQGEEPVYNISEPSCNSCDGGIEASVPNSTATVTFSWADIDENPLGNSSAIQDQCAGNYIITTSIGGGACIIIDTLALMSPDTDDPSFNFDDFCFGESNQPTNIATSGGVFSFNPTPTDGATIDTSTGVISNETIGSTYTVEYTVPGIDCPTSETISVTVNGFTYTEAITDATCEDNNGAITLTTNNTGDFEYSIDNGANTQSTGIFGDLDGGTYNILIIDENGCEVTGTAIVDNIGSPEINAPEDINVCIGGSVTLTADNPDNATISWDNGITDGQTFTPDQTGTTTYTVTAISPEGCEATDNVNVIVHALPVPTFEANITEGCYPLTAVFTNTTDGSHAECFWDFGDGNTSTDCGPVSHTYTEPGNYTVTLSVTNGNGCEATDSEVDYITVIERPIASFTASPTETTLNNTEVEFTNNSTNANSYDWDFGDGNGSNMENPSNYFPNDEIGTYEVTLYASNDHCTDSSKVTINIIYPDPEYEIPNVFTPNNDGENDFFKLTHHLNVSSVEVVILNRWGNKVYESSEDADFRWNGKVNNSGAECSEGVYFFKMILTDFSDREYEEHGFVHLVRGK